MHVNTGLAQLSNGFLLTALVGYSLGVVAFAGNFAYGRRAGTRPAALPRVPQPAPAHVRTAGGIADGDGFSGDRPPRDHPGGAAGSDAPAAPTGNSPQAGPWVRAALALTVSGAVAHPLGVLARGLAVRRVPWGDMYEFVTALTCVAVVFFLVVMIRYRVWYLGLFVMSAVVLALGLAETVIYTPAGPLAPALQSYWLAIHVTAMTLATGIFFVAAVMGAVYLCADRYARRIAAGKAPGADGILRRLPAPAVIDRLAYRTVVFGFPIWTFGIMAGAIWGDQAWGRYWGWDPVETWAFITWVVYACFLHARATAGWRPRGAAVIQLVGFGCLLFNVAGVQVFITGLHSYAGLS